MSQSKRRWEMGERPTEDIGPNEPRQSVNLQTPRMDLRWHNTVSCVLSNHDKRHRQGQMARGIDQSPHNTVALWIWAKTKGILSSGTSTKALLVVSHKRAWSIVQKVETKVLVDLHNKGLQKSWQFIASSLGCLFLFQIFFSQSTSRKNLTIK